MIIHPDELLKQLLPELRVAAVFFVTAKVHIERLGIALIGGTDLSLRGFFPRAALHGIEVD